MWKTWAMILRMFHEENIVFLTRRSAVFQTQSWSYGGLTVVLRWSYDSSRGKSLELSTDKGTKKVRETSDMLRYGH